MASLRETAVGSAVPLEDSDNPLIPGHNTRMMSACGSNMKLPADRVGALAFRAREGAHQKNDGDAVGVCARRQPGIYFCGREMPASILSLRSNRTSSSVARSSADEPTPCR